VRVKAGELVAPDAVDDEIGGRRRAGADVAPISYVPAPALPTASKPVPLQLDLRGQRAADAVEEVERYLDDAYLAGLQSVRIVHGHGTGAVRKAVRDRLSHHSLVRSWAPAERNQGGDGATDVQLSS
jgi:DNA mismatch repair protein MutS2